jgi:hypothetical protein
MGDASPDIVYGAQDKGGTINDGGFADALAALGRESALAPAARAREDRRAQRERIAQEVEDRLVPIRKSSRAAKLQAEKEDDVEEEENQRFQAHKAKVVLASQ